MWLSSRTVVDCGFGIPSLELREIVGTYIARKRSKDGLKFGFVSFKGVNDWKKLESRLNGLKLGPCKLMINRERFAKENGKVEERKIPPENGQPIFLSNEDATLAYERLAWIKFHGVPLHLAENKVFDDVASLFGNVVKGSQLSLNDWDLSTNSVGVLVDVGSRITDTLDDWVPDYLFEEEWPEMGSGEGEEVVFGSSKEGNMEGLEIEKTTCGLGMHGEKEHVDMENDEGEFNDGTGNPQVPKNHNCGYGEVGQGKKFKKKTF
ncbi:putative RNA-binding domain superfamily [Helianthus anomalus]